jgi:hypothetical protein
MSVGFSLAPVDGFFGGAFGVSGRGQCRGGAFGVSGRGQCRGGAFGVSGRGQCRGGAFGVSGLRKSDILFSTISHCAWRHVISDMTFLVKSDGFDFDYVDVCICAIS